MSKGLFGILTISLLLAASASFAANQLMEQCKVVDSDGNGLIKPYSADSGANLQNDPDAWIWVPYGQCAQINKGDYNGISPQIIDKLETGNTADTTAIVVE